MNEPLAAGSCFERLTVIDDDRPRSGPVNMAVDELLLDGSPQRLPVLRFYLWAEPTVSFGCFEPVEDARRLARGRPVVRRPTAGGLVEHGGDLTFTLTAPRHELFVRLRPAESYRLLHGAVASVLARGGWRADPHPESDGSVRGTDGNECFQRPVQHDLIAAGHKIAGGAQRRTRAGLMHQGSVRVNGTQVASWSDLLRRHLPAALAACREVRALTADEVMHGEELAAAKYATAAWTDRM